MSYGDEKTNEVGGLLKIESSKDSEKILMNDRTNIMYRVELA